MTTRSVGSTASFVPREDSDVYIYALKVAVLSHAIKISSNPPPVPPTSLAAPPPAPGIRHAASFRPADGWTNAMFSLGDIFKDSGGGKEVRFPKDFAKVLDAKLERVARGAEAEYSDVWLKRAVGAFYGKAREPAFQRIMKETRKVEELILMFVATAKKLLGDEELKAHLDDLIRQFVNIVRDCLKSKETKNVPAELLRRLESYSASLPSAPSSAAAVAETRSYHNNSPTPSRIVSEPGAFTPPPTPAGVTTNLKEMPLAAAVGKLFRKANSEVLRDVASLKRICTEKSAFIDLKSCINNVAKGAKFPARREDFDSDDAFQAWKKQESAELQELLLGMIKRKPELLVHSAPTEVFPRSTSSAPTDYSNGLRSSPSISELPGGTSPDGSSVGLEGGEDDNADSAFIFVPPDPQYYYKRIFEIALDHDYGAMKDLPPDEAVSLSILSAINEELLGECEKMWRIFAPARVNTFLALIIQHYKHQGVPEACVGEALSDLDRVAGAWSYWRWPWAERQRLFKSLSALFDILLTRFFEIFQGILDLPFDEVVELLERVHENEVFAEDIQDLPIIFEELQAGMSKFVGIAYEAKEMDVEAQAGRFSLLPLLSMLNWIKAEAKKYDKKFPSPLLGSIDVPAIFVGVAAPEFLRHLDASRNLLLAVANQVSDATNDEDLIEVYRGVVELQKLHKAFCPENPLVVDVSSWFEPYVRRWLALTDAKTSEWVGLAIAHDKFEAEGDDGHSSSVVDLIASCRSATDFIVNLKFPDEYENARYLTALSQTIAKSIEQYSGQLETLFMREMSPPKRENSGDDLDLARPSAWLTKAKLVVQGDKKVEPFVFQPQSCVKLNNIQAARKLLDSMYTALDADKVARIVEMNAPPPPPKKGPDRYLFTVKIVLGENLVGPNGSPKSKVDPFLILSDPRGNRVAKTRTLYETNDPRWEETTDIPVLGDLWLKATVYHRNLVDEHEPIARAYIHLNPAVYSDFLPKDVWLDLEDSNQKKMASRILLRISMEGEKDDIQFYFGRAFRSLKRAEDDMTRTIVDKMSPFVRHYLSLPTLKNLVKKGLNFDIDLERVREDLSKVGVKFNAYVRDTFQSDSKHTIPPVEDHTTPTSVSKTPSKRGKGPLTDHEIEDAIGDLLDYFETTFATLKVNLSHQAWDLVIARLWKDILSTIEALIVPPLSNQPTQMKTLSDKEVDIVFKWLVFLVNFFHAGGEGVPLEELRTAKYRELIEARMYYDWAPDALMEEHARSIQRSLLSKSGTILNRNKSVYSQRNLNTIKARKKGKKEAQATTSGEMILRILRMYPGTGDFISQQMETQQRLQAEHVQQQQRVGSLQRNGGGGNTRGGRSGRPGMGRDRSSYIIPSLPRIPDSYQ